MPPTEGKIQKKDLKTITYGLPTMVGQQKIWFIACLKYLFHHSENSSCSKKINIGRKSTSSQWLILFRKIRPCKLTLLGSGNFIPRVLIYDQQWRYEKVFNIGKIKKLKVSKSTWFPWLIHWLLCLYSAS